MQYIHACIYARIPRSPFNIAREEILLNYCYINILTHTAGLKPKNMMTGRITTGMHTYTYTFIIIYACARQSPIKGCVALLEYFCEFFRCLQEVVLGTVAKESLRYLRYFPRDFTTVAIVSILQCE